MSEDCNVREIWGIPKRLSKIEINNYEKIFVKNALKESKGDFGAEEKQGPVIKGSNETREGTISVEFSEGNNKTGKRKVEPVIVRRRYTLENLSEEVGESDKATEEICLGSGAVGKDHMGSYFVDYSSDTQFAGGLGVLLLWGDKSPFGCQSVWSMRLLADQLSESWATPVLSVRGERSEEHLRAAAALVLEGRREKLIVVCCGSGLENKFEWVNKTSGSCATTTGVAAGSALEALIYDTIRRTVSGVIFATKEQVPFPEYKSDLPVLVIGECEREKEWSRWLDGSPWQFHGMTDGPISDDPSQLSEWKEELLLNSFYFVQEKANRDSLATNYLRQTIERLAIKGTTLDDST